MVTEDPFGPEAHDRGCPTHSGKHGHYCNEFDGLWICEDCIEWDVCTCYGSHPPIHGTDKPISIKDWDKF